MASDRVTTRADEIRAQLQAIRDAQRDLTPYVLSPQRTRAARDAITAQDIALGASSEALRKELWEIEHADG